MPRACANTQSLLLSLWPYDGEVMRRILLVALSSETQSLHRRETASSIERPGGCEVSPLL